MAFVMKVKARNPREFTAGELVAKIWEQFEIEISVNRLSELLKPLGSSNPVGHPRLTPAEAPAQAAGRDVDHAGAFFPPGRPERARRAGGRAGRR